MKLQIYLDRHELEDDEFDQLIKPITEAISDWSSDKEQMVLLTAEEDERFGLSFEIKKSHKLKAPLNFLYGLAKEHKCEFVIAQLDSTTGEAEDVCYFGFEEGKPDLFEVSSYLGL